MVICLERDAALHMAQLMPLPLTVSCFSKIQIGFTFLVLADPGSPGKRAIKRVFVQGRGQSITFGGLEPRAWRARESEPITGVWGLCPQRGPRAEPLVRQSGGRSPAEAENLLASGCATEAANLPHSVRTLTLSK